MKRIIILVASLFILNISFASFFVSNSLEKPVVETKEQRKKAMMEMVVKMSVKEYEIFTGRKMNFINRLAFKIEKKRFEKQLEDPDAETSGFNLGAFALGLFLLPFGVVLAYVFSQDTNFHKWAWIGCGVGVLVWVLLYAIALGSALSSFGA